MNRRGDTEKSRRFQRDMAAQMAWLRTILLGVPVIVVLGFLSQTVRRPWDSVLGCLEILVFLVSAGFAYRAAFRVVKEFEQPLFPPGAGRAFHPAAGPPAQAISGDEGRASWPAGHHGEYT